METCKLSPLQSRIVRTLAPMEPRWTLTGGAALVGFHTRHRQTRDLDLFWHGSGRLERIPQDVRDRLANEGLEVSTTQTALSFSRLRVSDGRDVVLVDLVADSSELVEMPVVIPFEGVDVSVDTLHEILVNKLCALLGRTEVRDLQDVKAILEAGGDLERALADAPEKDGGFSGPTLAWLLRQFPLAEVGRASGLDPSAVADLERFRDELVERVLKAAHPGASPEECDQ